MVDKSTTSDTTENTSSLDTSYQFNNKETVVLAAFFINRLRNQMDNETAYELAIKTIEEDPSILHQLRDEFIKEVSGNTSYAYTRNAHQKLLAPEDFEMELYSNPLTSGQEEVPNLDDASHESDEDSE